MIVATALLLLAGLTLTSPTPRRDSSWRPRVWPRLRWRPRRRTCVDVASVLVEVAARLRAGAPLPQAWVSALPRPAPDWSAPVLQAAAGGSAAESTHAPGTGGPDQLGSNGPDPPWWRRLRRPTPGADVAAAAAACRLAARTGAPLAEVIDVVVAGVAESAEADALRRTALAGPRATARLLSWLPAGGIALGMLLGADPIGVLLGGGLGGWCLVGGAALFLAGHRWVATEVRRAERAGA